MWWRKCRAYCRNDAERNCRSNSLEPSSSKDQRVRTTKFTVNLTRTSPGSKIVCSPLLYAGDTNTSAFSSLQLLEMYVHHQQCSEKGWVRFSLSAHSTISQGSPGNFNWENLISHTYLHFFHLIINICILLPHLTSFPHSHPATRRQFLLSSM